MARALDPSGPLQSAASRSRRVARAGRDLQIASERRRQARRLAEPHQDRVEPVDRQVVVRVERQRLFERVGRPLRILGGPGQQLAQGHQMTDARLGLGLDRRQPPQTIAASAKSRRRVSPRTRPASADSSSGAARSALR